MPGTGHALGWLPGTGAQLSTPQSRCTGERGLPCPQGPGMGRNRATTPPCTPRHDRHCRAESPAAATAQTCRFLRLGCASRGT